jgi:Rv2525c-like, glycoside hydrolase-like domain
MPPRLLGSTASILRQGKRSDTAGGVGLLLLVLATLAATGLLAPAALARTVSYHGVRLSVPNRWPVFRLGRDSRTCVRFNRHALYLGSPGRDQRCPVQALGRTEAILVQPLGTGGAALPSGSGSAGELTLRGLRITATWGNDRPVVQRALGRRMLHPVPRASAAAAARVRPDRSSKASTAGVYTGLGFDACSAPSTSTMSAWGSSPYRAVGIYIGGANEGCSQPNLNADWVTTETAAGWHLIPTYVGLQAPGACGCSQISLSTSQAAAQGSAAASDAATEAQALGIGAGNPIYDDMEGYPRTAANTAAVRAFVSGWTSELHALGYVAGVYSSGDSGIADLAASYGSGSPDDIWIARWNNQQSTADPQVASTEWANHQRLHQYSGGHNATYGGVTINIDSNYLDGAIAGGGDAVIDTSCTSDIPDGTFVQVSGSYAVYRIAGGAPLFVSNWSTVGGAQAVTELTQDQFDALCAVPTNGTFLGTSTGSYYRVAGGAALPINDWTPFGGPQPSITIDPWDTANAGNPDSHLLAQPVAGTVVRAMPSNTYWQFASSYRTPVGARSSAILVDDASLSPFKIVECKAPRLKHLTFPKTKRAIRRAHCTLGKVHRPRHWSPHHKLRVYWQIPRANSIHSAGWKIGIKMR